LDRGRPWPVVRGGLPALLIIVAIAGCGGSNPSDSGDAPSVDAREVAAKDFVKFARQVASGRFVTVRASGTADDPTRILLSLKATPPQMAQVGWTMKCSKGSSAETMVGLRTVQTPVSMVLKQPMEDNDSCFVSANATLSGAGEVVLKLARSTR